MTTGRKQPTKAAPDPLSDAVRQQSEADAARERVSEALRELLHNPQTPASLYEAVAEFVANGVSDETLHTASFVRGLIAQLNDPIGARREAVN